MLKWTLALLLLVSSQAHAVCVESPNEIASNSEMSAFVGRLGGIQNLTGKWNFRKYQIEFQFDGDRIRGRIDKSSLAPLRICTTGKPNRLHVEILNVDGTIFKTTDLETEGVGRIRVRGGPLNAFYGFTQTVRYGTLPGGSSSAAASIAAASVSNR